MCCQVPDGTAAAAAAAAAVSQVTSWACLYVHCTALFGLTFCTPSEVCYDAALSVPEVAILSSFFSGMAKRAAAQQQALGHDGLCLHSNLR
jgi:hypothetical protein